MTAEAKPEKIKVNRREFLNLAWLASLGFLTVNLAGVTYLFAMPRFKEGEFGGVVSFTSAEVPSPGGAPGDYPKVKIWLANSEEGVTAIYKVCTHLGCLYNWNTQENKFICPCHGSQFELDGDYIQGPAPRSLDRFHVDIVDASGAVLASTPEDGSAVPLPDGTDYVIKVDTGKKITGESHA